MHGLSRKRMALTLNGGPHGMHNVNSQAWVNGHEHFASTQACGTCHGTTGTGTVISRAAVSRTFSVEDRGNVNIPKGTQIGCGLCHENVLAGGRGKVDPLIDKVRVPNVRKASF